MKSRFMRRALSITLIGAFVSSSLYMPQAQASGITVPFMPKPGTMVTLSPAFSPAQLLGITIDPNNPLKFDFLINKGDEDLTQEQKQLEYTNLVKYFLASLTIPDKDQWVNLSPYEHNRIIADNFGKTEMGRDLLEEDYLLKQITSSLMFPESGLGKKFWNRVYARAWEQYHTTEIPVNTFNKVWIIPDQAAVYESGNTVYVINSHLKVMLDEDYLSLRHHTNQKTHTVASRVIREIILPELEKEVNTDRNFANLRQMVSGMILAMWYKRALKESLLGKVYADQAKVAGVEQFSSSNEAIYRQYLAAFKKGVYNYIKEDEDKFTHQLIPRKYFAGGFQLGDLQITNEAMLSAGEAETINRKFEGIRGRLDRVRVILEKGVARARAAIKDPYGDQRTAAAQKRLDRLGIRIQEAVGEEFTYHVVRPGSSLDLNEESPAFINLATREIFVKQGYMEMEQISDDELLAVLGHEIAHAIHRDDDMDLLMENLSLTKPAGDKVFKLYEEHKEIEADKRSFTYMDKLGIDKMNLVTALEKAVAYARKEKKYTPRTDEIEIRLQVMRDRINHPDELTDFYTTSRVEGAASAVGFRNKTKVTNINERAENLFLVYGFIQEKLQEIQNARAHKEGFLDYFIGLYSDKVKGYQRDQQKFSEDSYSHIMSLGFDIAFLDYLIDNYVEKAKGSFGSEYEYLHYRDQLKNQRDALGDFLESLLGEDVRTETIRHQTSTHMVKKYYPNKKLEVLDVDFPTEFFTKLIAQTQIPRSRRILLKIKDFVMQDPVRGLPRRVPKHRPDKVSKDGTKDESSKRRWRLILIPFLLLGLEGSQGHNHPTGDLPAKPKPDITKPSVPSGTLKPPESPLTEITIPPAYPFSIPPRIDEEDSDYRIIGYLNNYGSGPVETSTHFPANQKDNVESFDTQAGRLAIAMLQSVLTPTMWQGLLGESPQAVKFHGRAVKITQKDIDDYIQGFYSINQNTKVLNKKQNIGAEAAIGAFEKYFGLSKDYDIGKNDWMKMVNNPVVVFQMPQVLTDQMWQHLAAQDIVIVHTANANVVVKGSQIMAYKAVFQNIKPFKEEFTVQEEIATKLAMEAFGSANGFMPLVTNPDSEQVLLQRAQSILLQIIRKDDEAPNPAMLEVKTPASEYGGIDLNSANVNLQITRNGSGVPIPVSQQNITQLGQLQGFVPSIIDIQPVTQLPFLSEIEQKLKNQPMQLASSS